jgi:hypothetical protein
MKRGMACLAGIGAAGTALAQPAPPPTRQQQFEAASNALATGHWKDAAAQFESLEPRVASDPRSLAVVRARKGEALAALGHNEEAEQALKLGLAGLAASDPTLTDDRFDALTTLGEVAERSLDYGEALKDYQAAEPLVPDIVARERTIRGLIQTGMFYDAPAALARADAAIAAAAALHPRNSHLEATFRILRGRVLLNMGRPKDAEEELQRAVDLLGGLTERVDAADLASRSDLAIAALQSGDQEKARKFMSWTGAGHFENGFPVGEGMLPPPCGDDLKPADVAVVEFSIRDDGTIGHATPVYSSRQGPSALAFAQAVSGWWWKPEQLVHIKPLFRAMTRVELRCSTRGEHPSILGNLHGDLDRWLEARAVPPLDQAGRSDAARLKPLEAELKRREAAGAASPALLPVLADLASNVLVPRDERRAYLRRGLAIAQSEKAPPAVLGWFAIGVAYTGWNLESGRNESGLGPLRALLADPVFGGDPRVATAIRLAIAENLYGHASTKEAIATLSEVAATPGLDPHEPLRAAALARLASLQLIAGDAAAARAAYAASGLNAQQCALLDNRPRMTTNGATDKSFPMEAQRWGFEGWVHLEFDLSAEGKPTNVRPIISYPAFVFDKSATGILDASSYDRTFRPDGALGCGGMVQGVNYRL